MSADPASIGGVPAAVAARLAGVADDAPDARRALAVGGVVPALVARPADAGELAAVVAEVAAAGAALVPLGRGAHRDLGHPPTRYDVALVTSGLARVVDYTPADMTVTVEAGATIADLDALLAREGQWLSLEPPVPATTTVGGLLATDRSGLLAVSQGRIRDLVIGIRVVTAAGTAARAGGRVVKNVAGYDLMKLVVGSLGTLAVLTEVTFKVRPRPEVEHGLLLVAPTPAAAIALGRAVDGAFAVVADGALAASTSTRLVVRLGGGAAEVAARRERVMGLVARHRSTVACDAPAGTAEVAECFAALRDFPLAAGGDLVVRLAALPDRLEGLVCAALAALPDSAGTWCADVARGVVTIAASSGTPGSAARALTALVRVADAHAAHLVVERWPAPLATTVTVWHPRPLAFPLMQRMKAALDPAGVLAPGRYVGRL